MASSGPLSPATIANDSSNFGAVAWTNPSNAVSSNNSRATAALGNTDLYDSQWIKATNFGFAIPAGATIDGVVVEIEGYASADGPSFDVIKLVRAGSPVGSSIVGGSLSDAEAYTTHGGASNTGGVTFTASEVNSTGFGVAISCYSGSPATVLIDHIRVTVHYTAASGGGSSRNPSSLGMLGVG